MKLDYRGQDYKYGYRVPGPMDREILLGLISFGLVIVAVGVLIFSWSRSNLPTPLSPWLPASPPVTLP